MNRIANAECRQYVADHKPFQGNNMWGEWVQTAAGRADHDRNVYVVFSYGDHFPMFIYTEGMWFENEDKYSPTTSKHMSQARPTDKTILLPTEWMLSIVRGIQEVAL